MNSGNPYLDKLLDPVKEIITPPPGMEVELIRHPVNRKKKARNRRRNYKARASRRYNRLRTKGARL